MTACGLVLTIVWSYFPWVSEQDRFVSRCFVTIIDPKAVFATLPRPPDWFDYCLLFKQDDNPQGLPSYWRLPMTIQQNAIWEMWCQGLHQLAALSEQRWEHGEQVERDDAIQAPRFVWTLIQQANRQIHQRPG